MDNILKGALLGVIIILTAWVLFLTQWKVPDLEQQLYDWENAEPRVVEKIIEGPVDTVEIIRRDTVNIPTVGETELLTVDENRRSYKTPFSDKLLSGEIFSEVDGHLVETSVNYWFKRDIVETHRVDKHIVEIERNVIRYRDRPQRQLDLGFLIGGTPSGDFMLGPSLGYLSRSGNSFSYSYDVLNDGHYVTFRRKLSFPKISLF